MPSVPSHRTPHTIGQVQRDKNTMLQMAGVTQLAIEPVRTCPTGVGCACRQIPPAVVELVSKRDLLSPRADQLRGRGDSPAIHHQYQFDILAPLGYPHCCCPGNPEPTLQFPLLVQTLKQGPPRPAPKSRRLTSGAASANMWPGSRNPWVDMLPATARAQYVEDTARGVGLDGLPLCVGEIILNTGFRYSIRISCLP